MDWRNKLLRTPKYSEIFEDTFQFDPPIGWKTIVDNLLQYIHWHNQVHRSEIRLWKCSKENGGLRFHIDTRGNGREGLEEVFGAIQFAEIMANSTCERCGNPGELHKFQVSGSLYLTTLCEYHADKVNAVQTED
jgi:hypothetical protein